MITNGYHRTRWAVGCGGSQVLSLTVLSPVTGHTLGRGRQSLLVTVRTTRAWLPVYSCTWNQSSMEFITGIGQHKTLLVLHLGHIEQIQILKLKEALWKNKNLNYLNRTFWVHIITFVWVDTLPCHYKQYLRDSSSPRGRAGHSE